MREPTRRQVLAGLGAGVAALAGCSQGGGETPSPDAGGSPTPGPTPVDELLSPPVKGNPDADVTLAVYEDFGCPHCRHYNEQGLPKLADEYIATGEIRYEHRDLPIPVLNPQSWQAANAARTVQDHAGDGAFWTYAEALFANQGALRSKTPGLYATLAEGLSVDGGTVRTAGVQRLYRKTVRRDRQRGIELGVEATPTFVVNGEIVTNGFGSGTVETLRSAIEQRL